MWRVWPVETEERKAEQEDDNGNTDDADGAGLALHAIVEAGSEQAQGNASGEGGGGEEAVESILSSIEIPA